MALNINQQADSKAPSNFQIIIHEHSKFSTIGDLERFKIWWICFVEPISFKLSMENPNHKGCTDLIEKLIPQCWFIISKIRGLESRYCDVIFQRLML